MILYEKIYSLTAIVVQYTFTQKQYTEHSETQYKERNIRHNRVHKHNHRIHFLLTPWSRVLLDKLTDLQLVKKFLTFYGTRKFGSLPHSEASATYPYPGPAQSSPHTHIPPPGDPS